jgi:2'-5' RNA ligase
LWPHGLAVLCPRDVPESLYKLHNQLAHQLHRLNLPVESRPYRPHVTLARRATDATPPTSLIPVVWSVRQFALVVSARDTGQRYRIIRQFG